MKGNFYNLYSEIVGDLKDNLSTFDVLIVFEDVVLNFKFNEFVKSSKCRMDFFFQNAIFLDYSEIPQLTLFRIIILVKILRMCFSEDVGYGQIFEYAKDLGNFIRDFYVYNLSKKKLEELSAETNNFSFIIYVMEFYEQFLKILKEEDASLMFKKYLISSINGSNKVFRVSYKKKSVKRYDDIFNNYQDKIKLLQLYDEDIVLNDSIKIFYNEFYSIFDKADFISFFIHKKINIFEKVVVVSDNNALNDLILFNLKKIGYDTEVSVNFSKTELYGLLIGVTEILVDGDVLCFMDLLKNNYIALDEDFFHKFEIMLRSVSTIESNIHDLINRFMKIYNSGDGEIFCEKSVKVITIIYDMIKEYNTRNKNNTFCHWMVFHKTFIKKVISKEYFLLVDSFFNFVDDSINNILNYNISFCDYVDILKKISEFFYLPYHNLSNKDFKIINSLSDISFDVDHILFVDVSDENFPIRSKNNYWVNEFDREKLGLTNKFSINDFFNIINFAKKSCLMMHSIIEGSKRSHFVDIVLDKHVDKIKPYDLSEYNNYKNDMLIYVKNSFIKNMTIPKLPSPSPDISIRPTKFSATDIGSIVKNPYKIYVKYVLGLKGVNFYNIGLEYISKGNTIHKIMQQMFQNCNILCSGNTELINRLWRYNLRSLYRYYALEMNTFLGGYQKSYTEIHAMLNLGQFFISARADRVDVYCDGGISIIDYKTGILPSKTSIIDMINPQILVEGIIFKYGQVIVRNIKFIRQLKLVKLSKRIDVVEIDNKNTDLDGLLDLAKDNLLSILEKSLKDPYDAYKIKENNMENDPIFLLSRAHEFYTN